jgi:hypothetical protein
VTELGGRSYDDLLVALAAPAATPGGGTAAALAAGFACALVERCAAAAGQLDLAARAAELRPQLVAIGEDDVEAVVAGGSGPPRRLRDAAAELEQAAAALERDGAPRLRGEAGVARVLAQAAVRAADAIVALNEAHVRPPAPG